MPEALQTIALAAAMYAATNVDDLVLLGIFCARPGARMGHIVLGQVVGIGALTALSGGTSLVALAVLRGWLPWMGLLPLAIGIRWLKGPEEGAAPEGAPLAWWRVAGITLANGADNVGVYVPAFAVQSRAEIAMACAVFLVLTLAWCALARWAVRHPRWGAPLRRWLGIAAPLVLIALGVWIVAHHPWFGLAGTA